MWQCIKKDKFTKQVVNASETKENAVINRFDFNVKMYKFLNYALINLSYDQAICQYLFKKKIKFVILKYQKF